MTIPANALSASFNIQTIDSHMPKAPYQAGVSAAAAGYLNQAAYITIVDDDAPSLTLTFADSVISKGAPNPATYGTITASMVTTQAVTVLLQTTSPAINIPSSAVISSNQLSVTFPVNAVQDNLVTGDRLAIVTAQLSDANSPIPVGTGAASASITVADNNGPALSVTIASGLIPENGSTIATVTRNTLPTNALTVSLVSSLTNAATVPSSVSIPIGSASATFTVSGYNPGFPTGPRRVDISAPASGYSTGVAALNVTDINLPDLSVSSVAVPTAGLATSNVTVSYSVVNNGLAPTTNAWHDAIFYSTSANGANPQLLTETYQAAPLQVGQSYTNRVVVTLPSAPGSDYIVVTTDSDSAVVEGNYLNNTAVSTTPITNSPAYQAFIQADISTTVGPNPVPMHGYAYSSVTPSQRVPLVPVDIGVLVKGTRRDFTVFTDSNGNFTYLFQPIPGEAGHYSLTADYPGLTTGAPQSTFDIYGVRFADTRETLNLYPNTNVAGQSSVLNLSDLPLTGVTAQASGLPASVTMQLIITNQIGSDDEVPLSYSLSVGSLTSPISVQAYIQVSSDQGAVAYLPFSLTIAPQTAVLVCNPTTLQSSMLIGEQTLVDFDVKNIGGAPSGPITLELPVASWLSAASLTNIPSLAPGQSNRFLLSLTPDLNLPLEMYQGSLYAAASTANLNIPFAFRAISDAIGGLQIAAQDEYTYFVAGSPQVTNALVVLTDPITGSVLASNVTDPTGTVLFTNLDQGSYQMTVTAPKHDQYQSPVTIQPGKLAQATAFLSRQTVTYTWAVVPTTEQDQYQVTLQAQYETEVPIPVVTIDNPLLTPLMIEGMDSEMDVQVSNHGLIAAEQISLNVPTDDPDYIYTPLTDYMDEIPAMSSIVIPVLISWRTNATQPDFVTKYEARHRTHSPKLRQNGISKCKPLPNISLQWSYLCGPDQHWHLVDADIVMTAVTPDCSLLSKDCLDAVKGLSKGVNKESACQALSCIEGCISDQCLVTILNVVCGLATGDAKGAITSALKSGNCICPEFPPLPFGGQQPPTTTPPPPTGVTTGGGGEIGGPIDPIEDPVEWDYSACTPGETQGGSIGGSMRKPRAKKDANGPTTTSGDVCAHVTIQLSQKIAITRAAFQGTLSLSDNDPANGLSNVLVVLSITDENGNPADSLFGIQPPALSGINAVDGTGVLAPGASGTAQYTLTPTHDAAPTGPVHYQVGGTIAYVQSSNTVTVPLAPQDIYVYPDPVLNLDYFLQRDVIGDDPNQPGTVSPQPFDLGLMVRNVGAGSALNFTITSGQPRIVENSKGLLINFQILGTQVGTNPVNPSLTANLGQLAPGSTTVADWQLLCSLAGKFISYNATYQHMSQLGSLQTSLIDNLNIHELIHTFMSVRPGDDAVPDFLVNDIPDPANLPDTVYLSDGTTNSVTIITGATTDGSIGPKQMQAVLRASMSAGWNYLEAPDPGPGYRLYRAIRSDGLDMKVPYNVWTTPLSFPATQTGAVHMNLIHLLDYNGTGSYTLYYHTTNTIPPTIVGLQTVTPFIQSGSISSLQITFSEPIDLSTFGSSTITLTRDGGPNLVSNSLTITPVSDATYSINGLAPLTGNSGNYQLTVNGTQIQDLGGNSLAGNPVVSTSWAEGNAPLVVQSIQAISPNPRNAPVDSITVAFDKAVTASSFDYRAISLTLNGGANLSGSGIVVTPVNSSSFQISGLAAVTGAPGTYVLTINAAAVLDSGGNAGTGSAGTSWIVITTGPAVTSMPAPQSPRNIVVQSQNVTFSEPIDPNTFDDNALTLTRNGGPNLITSAVTVARQSPTNFQIQNFNWVSGYDGAYALTVDATKIKDLAGNPGTASASVTWIMSTHQPPAPANLILSPLTGIYPGITASNLITLSGTVASNGLTVRIIDQTTGQDLGAVTAVGTNFSAQLNLSQGNHLLQVYAVDPAANVSSNNLVDVVVDQTPLYATLDAVVPNLRLSPITNLNITFDKPIDTNSIHPANVSLVFNATNVFPPSLTMISSNVYQIGGLASRTAAPGNYQLICNLSGVRDVAGNTGSGAVSVSWQNSINALLPVISPTTNATAVPGQELQLSFSVTDPSGYAVNLQLGAGAPAGLALTTNVLTWTPSCAQGSSSNLITIWAVEESSAALSNSLSFAIMVGDCVELQLGSSIVFSGSTSSVPVNLFASAGVTNLSFTLDFPTNRLGNWAINPSNSAVEVAKAKNLNATQTVFTVSAKPGQVFSGSSLLASLAFGASAGSSAFAPLSLEALLATKANDVPVAAAFAGRGRVIILGPEPLLEAQWTNSARNLLLYGLPGNSYQIQSSTVLDGKANWFNLLRVPLTNVMADLSNLNQSADVLFYRAYSFNASPPIIDVSPALGDGIYRFVFFGMREANYEIQFATNLAPANHWYSLSNYTLSNSFFYFDLNKSEETNRLMLYRLEQR